MRGGRGAEEEVVACLRCTGVQEATVGQNCRFILTMVPPQENNKPLFSTHPPSNLNIPNIPSFLGMFVVCSEFQ